MYTISKQFFFEFGHRVWNQSLTGKPNKCRHLHGHSGMIEISISSGELVSGMVMDFSNLDFMKEFIEKNLDHKFLMDMNDPLLSRITFALSDQGDITPLIHQAFKTDGTIKIAESFIPIISRVAGVNDRVIGLKLSETEKNLPLEINELFGSLVILPFSPTAENLSRWIFEFTTRFLSGTDVNIESVIFRETQKAWSKYE